MKDNYFGKKRVSRNLSQQTQGLSDILKFELMCSKCLDIYLRNEGHFNLIFKILSDIKIIRVVYQRVSGVVTTHLFTQVKKNNFALIIFLKQFNLNMSLAHSERPEQN